MMINYNFGLKYTGIRIRKVSGTSIQARHRAKLGPQMIYSCV